jgi:hypothetical protein
MILALRRFGVITYLHLTHGSFSGLNFGEPTSLVVSDMTAVGSDHTAPRCW